MRKAGVMLGLVLAIAIGGCSQFGDKCGGQRVSIPASEVIDLTSGKWVGPAISYSGYREGQNPDTGVYPTKAQILEDLRIIEKNWKVIRVYGSDKNGQNVLEVIREEGIGLKVMLGVWLGKVPGEEAFNAEQIKNCIRLANDFPDVVCAVNVGNEVMIYWTAHPVPEKNIIAYIREVKANVSVPVTLADNYDWWITDGANVAAEVDFITVHSYPVWERRGIEQGLSFTIENIERVRAALPGKPMVIGEAGWPSYTEGNHHVPQAGNEINQKRYYEELSAWAKDQGLTVFFFEAFDEPWKGTGTEGHWGFFSADRKAKLIMQDLYPDLMPDVPTSPTYGSLSVEPKGLSLAVPFRASLADRIEHGDVNFHGSGIGMEWVGENPDAVDGGSSLKVPFTGADWGGVYFVVNAVDAGGRDKLVVSLKIPDEVTEFELKIEGPSSKSQSLNLMEYPAAAKADGWKTFAVPTAVLKDVDCTQLSVIGFWSPRNATGAYVRCDVLLDDLHFE